MVDDIARAVAKRDARSVFFAFERLKGFEAALAGRRVTGVSARGKAVLIYFAARGDDGPWCVYSHNQLYGKWRITKAETEPKTNRQLRFAVVTDNKAARLYSASDIRLVRPNDLESIGYLNKLGPDPLNQALTCADIKARIADATFARRALGGLLLDQGFIAGIGNYLRSEILFVAGLAPKKRPADLSHAQQDQLAEAVLTLIWRAYELKGVTNTPERVAWLKQQGKRHGARRHMVFARAGQPCYECATPIERIDVASRRLYYCPVCQSV
tara:strand:+ start:676 stop:1485 length:810 start_codon:yes stop_codon:yes gene_type:complete